MTAKVTFNFPAPDSVMRNPSISIYFASGCLLVATAAPAGAGKGLDLVVSGGGAEEQAARASETAAETPYAAPHLMVCILLQHNTRHMQVDCALGSPPRWHATRSPAPHSRRFAATFHAMVHH